MASASARSSSEAKQSEKRDETTRSFKAHINMTARQVESWLKTDESKSVGRKKPGQDESVGRQSARKIIEILRKKSSEYDDDDLAHMRKVVGYIKRHIKQRPDGDITETRWRHSLMNWGHDPLKS